MKPLEMHALMCERPFKPFRIHLKDGRTLDIEYPELNLVTELRMAVGVPIPEDPGCGIADRFTYVYWDDIAKVEPLATCAQA